jgi:HTH-type transcriptional regulator / antitoxin HipB
MDFDITLAAQLGPQLKALRKLKGVSQQELGRQIGVKQVRIADIEANPGLVSVDQLLRILQVLGASLAIRTEVDDARASIHHKIVKSRSSESPLAGRAPYSVPVGEAGEKETEFLARMLGCPPAAIRAAMAKVSLAHPGSITERTDVRDIPESVFPALAKALELSPDTFERLFRATFSRLDRTRGTPLDRPTPKGTW